MSEVIETLAASVTARLGSAAERVPSLASELCYELPAERLRELTGLLRDAPELRFEVLADLSGVDYLHYGQDEWQTQAATSTGTIRSQPRTTE